MSARGWRLLAALGAAVVVWSASSELAWPARAMLVVVLTILPLLSVMQAEAAAGGAPMPPRVPVYLSSAAVLWLLALLTLGAGLASGLTTADLGLVSLGAGSVVGWTAAAIAAAIALAAGWRALGVRESPMLARLLPRTGAEKLVFVGLSLSAGVSEELVFRGFLIPALAAATGFLWLAVGLAAIVFGVVHAYQSPQGIVRAGLLGLILSVPLLATGSLVPSILAHFLYDVLVGLWLADWLLRR